VIKFYHVTLETPVEEPTVTCDTLNRKGIGYSLSGITSGVVKKRQVEKSGKTCGIFAKYCPEWMTVESAFDLDLYCVCVRDATFVANLASLYPKTTFITWEPDIILPPVNFIFCSHWVPPLTNEVWKCDMLEVLFASVEKFWFIKFWDWKSVPIAIEHSDVGGCSDMKRVTSEFVR
jgi:hypothetical protein